MSARQSKTVEKQRIHVHVAVDKLATIDKAAAALELSRAHFIATVAFAAAQVELAKLKKKKA